MSATRYRLGVDIGGTFTDGVLINEATGSISFEKVLTTPRDPSVAFLEVSRRLAENGRIAPEQIRYVMHATTTATNAIIERRGARAAMLLTAGFRDLLEIQRQVRHELYDLQTEKPAPLIPRRFCLDIPERLNYRGEVIVPLDEAAVERAAAWLRQEGINAIAICFLHAYRNPAHELRASEIIRSVHPAAVVSLSSEVAPEIREYWRASTTAVNAYIAPIVGQYLSGIEGKLRSAGFPTDVHVMQSNGGVTTASVAKERPICMIESGPAAGVRAAAYVAELMGHSNAISFDMGGTTAKMGLIRDGQPKVLPEFEVGAGSFSGTGLVKGSGYPILGAVMDLVEVGAGGGSLGWVDAGGLLRVGPRSAGADPGPACYGLGGAAPTITDANLALGRLDPDYFLGGQLRLDPAAAHEALRTHCGDPLAMEPVQAAMGIVEIANATMGEAVRLVTVQRGYDPRDFCLVAFGGAGPLHANALAADLGIPVVFIPPTPGVASALGMLVTDLRHDYRATRIQPLGAAELSEINGIFRGFERTALDTLAAEGVPRESARLERYVDVRYVGQSWKLTVPIGDGEVTDGELAGLKASFDRLHQFTYGFSVPEEPAELVNIGLLATGLIARTSLQRVEQGGRSPDAAAGKPDRHVYFREAAAFIPCHVFERNSLRRGNVIPGPAVIEEADSTVIVHPEYQAEVMEFGVLAIRRREREH